jgi:hypothetical protein
MRVSPCCLALVLLITGCGGPGSGGSEGKAKSASDAASSADDGAAERDEQPSEDADADEAGAEKPNTASCDDGTCSPCGDGICPSGWYCDEKAGACSWLPECADKVSCSCVTRVLGAACKCREEAGGLKVTCD